MTIRFAADSPAVAHGLGLFETLLVVRGQVFDLREHFRRMAASAETLGFPLPDEHTFRETVTRAAKEKDLTPECALRCLYAEDSTRWRLVATTFSIPKTTLRRRKGARAITLARDLVRALPQHKLTSYAASIVGLRQAIDAGADEGLFVDRRGRVLEGTTTNVFAIDGETLITARDAILPGIVRAWVIEHASRVLYRPPTIEELRNGSFLTSSLTELAPITTIDGIRCAPLGAAFQKLRAKYRRRSIQ
jgi:branched-subunit amino acid aminotransferase/4-amino-4-deoxychorismate lyase